MDLGLSGRRAAVAGGSAGLGLAVASALSAAGVIVAVCGRDSRRVEAAADGLGGRGIAIVADVGSAGGGAAFVAAANERLGQIDILVANAGGPPPGGFAATEPDAYVPALELSLLSVVGMCRAAVPAMRERGWGRVLAVTSIAARQPLPDMILSNTARAGVTGFLKSLAREVAGDGVTVNSLQPGLHATARLHEVYGSRLAAAVEAVPARAAGRPEDFGAVGAFLCSDHARYITGAALPIDGGAHTGLQ